MEDCFLGTLFHGFRLSTQGTWSVNLSTVQSLHNWLFFNNFLSYNYGKRIHGQMQTEFVYYTIIGLSEISTSMYLLRKLKSKSILASDILQFNNALRLKCKPVKKHKLYSQHIANKGWSSSLEGGWHLTTPCHKN